MGVVTLTTCSQHGCPRPVAKGYCPLHRPAAHARRNHAGTTRQQRGYGAEYQAQRAELLGGPCAMRGARCTGTATTAQHTDTGQLVGACSACNYADGQARATRARAHAREQAGART